MRTLRELWDFWCTMPEVAAMLLVMLFMILIGFWHLGAMAVQWLWGLLT